MDLWGMGSYCQHQDRFYIFIFIFVNFKLNLVLVMNTCLEMGFNWFVIVHDRPDPSLDVQCFDEVGSMPGSNNPDLLAGQNLEGS